MMKPKWTDVEILLSKFKLKTLKQDEWTHYAHLAVAFGYLVNYPKDEAIRYLRDGIKSLNIQHGNANTRNMGYHETLTIFWVEIIYHYLESKKDLPMDTIFEQFIDGCFSKSSLYKEFYSVDIVGFSEARAYWIPPDIQDFSAVFNRIMH